MQVWTSYMYGLYPTCVYSFLAFLFGHNLHFNCFYVKIKRKCRFQWMSIVAKNFIHFIFSITERKWIYICVRCTSMWCLSIIKVKCTSSSHNPSEEAKQIMFRLILSRLSFALSASKIKEKARVVAMDLRGHGKTSTENELDLSIEVWNLMLCKKKMEGLICNTCAQSFFWILFALKGFVVWRCLQWQILCNDVLAVLKTMYADSPPAVVLVGHR